MPLNKKFKELAMKEMDNLTIDGFGFESFFSVNGPAFKFLYDQEAIDDSELEEGLEKAVIRAARRSYDHMVKVKAYTVYPDNCMSPRCLAYGLEKGEFKGFEIDNINFDHGQNMVTFSQTYGEKNLISNLKNKLINHEKSPIEA